MNTISGLTPCKDCKNRALGCHASCSLYSDFKTDIEETHKRQKGQDGEYISYKQDRFKRNQW